MLGSKSSREMFVSGLSLENVYRDCRWLAEETPWRLSGSPESEKAARYIVNTLQKLDIDARLLEMHGYLNFPEPAELRMTLPSEKNIKCSAFAQIGSTPPEGLRAELVYVGSGAEEEYHNKDVRNKIVLCELSYAPPRPEKVRIAVSKGVAGVIMMNWGLDDNPLVPLGTVKSVWGNPTPGTIHLMENTPPVEGVSRKDGVFLRELLKKGEKVVVWMKTHSVRNWLKVYIPYAEVKAIDGDGDFLLVAGHMDSWAQGASDNASGNACKIDIARALQKNRHLLKHDVRFAFWQCHETGIMEGSTWFVDKFWNELDEHCIAYFNYDSPGIEGTSVWRSDTSSELLDWHRAVEKEVIPSVPKKRRKVERTGDQSFFGIGIPAMCCWMVHTDEEIKRWNGAILGNWYHSEDDTMKHIDRSVLDTCLKVYGAYTFEMATSEVLPMNFVTVADDFLERLQEIGQIIRSRVDVQQVIGVEPVIELAQRFRQCALKLENKRASKAKDKSEVVKINTAMKKLSRLLTSAKCTVSGRYDQDTYGLSALKKDLPALASIERMIDGEPGSHPFYLWSTEATRGMNRVSESLRYAIGECESL